MHHYLDDKALITSSLQLTFKDVRTAKAVNDALTPDNINLPKGMKINQVRRGSNLTIKVSADKLDSINSVISTLDELVSHAHTAVQTLEKVER